MKIAVCDDDKGCLDSMKRLLAGYPGISRTEYYQNLSQLSEALENGMGYDLVLMDLEWEGNEQDGIAYAAQYNARSPQTVSYTTITLPTTIEVCMSGGS